MFRLSTRADPTFLAEMLYEAVYWRDDSAEERPPLDALLAQPETARYVDGWGRPGDLAVLALDRRDEPVGAAWHRQFSAREPGYGFVADEIPEVSMAVYPEFRGQGVGSLLLGSLIARAHSNAQPALSLSVARDNRARRLYARHGFEVHAEHGDAFTMLLTIAG
ncbi:MAG: GNAT family N-acetyltransferase [Actinomycetota bacterium]